MARNWEKQLGRLNRFVLSKQKQDFLEKNPKRPNLGVLNTSDDISKWIPSIKDDLQFYLSQIKVGCYPEHKINEFIDKIDSLKKEYHAFVHKLKRLDPSCKIVPWTERSYEKDLHSKNHSKSINDVRNPSDTVRYSEATEKHNKTTTSCSYSNLENNAVFERLKLPILESKIEQDYKSEQFQPLVNNQKKSSQNCNYEIESLEIIQNADQKDSPESLKQEMVGNEHLNLEDPDINDDSRLLPQNTNIFLSERNPASYNCEKSVIAKCYNNEPLMFNRSVSSEMEIKKTAPSEHIKSQSVKTKQDNRAFTSVVDYSSSDSESP